MTNSVIHDEDITSTSVSLTVEKKLPDPKKERRYREALTATAAVCLAIFGGKWGSWLGVPPVYLTDVLIAIAAWHAFFSRRWTFNRNLRFSTITLVSLLLGWATLLFLIGTDHSVTALRDAAPYFYGVLALMAGASYRQSTWQNQNRSVRLLMAALSGHAVWCVIVTYYPSILSRMPIMPGSSIPLFYSRPDYDLTILGIYTALVFMRMIQGISRRPYLTLGWMAVCWGAILNNHSRAGLIGAVVAFSLVLTVILMSGDANVVKRFLLLALLPLVFATALLFIPQTEAGTRLFGDTGTGTKQARSDAWSTLIQYSEATGGRFTHGVGFGPNFMVDSSALSLLVGSSDDPEEKPRSPHNYWIGTLVRTGVIGLTLSLLIAAATALRVRRLLPHLYNNQILLVAALIFLSLLVPATVGVILESPFGAVPYFWSIGVLSAANDLARRKKVMTDASSQPLNPDHTL